MKCDWVGFDSHIRKAPSDRHSGQSRGIVIPQKNVFKMFVLFYFVKKKKKKTTTKNKKKKNKKKKTKKKKKKKTFINNFHKELQNIVKRR